MRLNQSHILERLESLLIYVQAFQKGRLRADCRQALGLASPAARLQRQRDRRGVWHLRDAYGESVAKAGESFIRGREAWFQRWLSIGQGAGADQRARCDFGNRWSGADHFLRYEPRELRRHREVFGPRTAAPRQ